MQNPLMDKDQFSQWKDHHLTKAFLSYLQRRRENLMEAWGSGVALSEQDQMEAFLCSQFLSLSSEDIAHVYGVEEENDSGRNEGN